MDMFGFQVAESLHRVYRAFVTAQLLATDLQKGPHRGHGAGSSVQNMPNGLIRMWLLRTLDRKRSSASDNIYVSASEGKPLPQASVL